MSSSSRFRPDRLAALVTALLVAVCAVQWWGATGAAAAQLDIVAVLPSPVERKVSLVAEIRPAAATPIRSESFSVTAGDIRLPTQAAPAMTGQVAIGLVFDASEAGAAALHAGLSGAANFLLQAPVGTRTAVVADTSPPALVAPLRAGPTDALRALSAVRAGGERNTSAALSLIVRQLPDTPGRLRLIVLYTSGPDAGGESATQLAARLTRAHAALVVVTTATGRPYWSRVTVATGGLVVTAQSSAVIAAFDHAADMLRARYLLTIPMPARLPAHVSVRVTTTDGTLTADALVPAEQAAAGRDESARSAADERRHALRILAFVAWTLTLITAVAITVVARRAVTRAAGPATTYQPWAAPRGGARARDSTATIDEPGAVREAAAGSETPLSRAGTVPPAAAAAGAPPTRGGARRSGATTTASAPGNALGPQREAAGRTTTPAPTGGTGTRRPVSVAAAVAAADRHARAVAARTAAEKPNWRTREVRFAYDSPNVRVMLVEAESPDGRRVEHQVVRLPRGALLVVFDEQDRVLMMWRHRFATDEWGWEIPGGIVDAGESGAATAVRTIEEQTGWRPTGSVEHLLSFQPMPGMVDTPQEIYVVRGAQKVGEPATPDHDIRIDWLPLGQVFELVRTGEVLGSASLVGLLYLLASSAPPGPVGKTSE